MNTLEKETGEAFSVTILEPETLPLFRELFPAAFIDRIQEPEAIFLGAVSGTGREACPAGALCMFGKEGKPLTLEWLYVDEPFRGDECGSILLDRAISIAEALGAPSVRAILPETEEGGYALEDFFTEAGFCGVMEYGTLFTGEPEDGTVYIKDGEDIPSKISRHMDKSRVKVITESLESLISTREEALKQAVSEGEEPLDLPPLPKNLQVDEVIYMTDL